MSERATERDGEHVTAIKSDETGRWVRIPDGVDGVRAYQLLRAASTDAPTEDRERLEDVAREIVEKGGIAYGDIQRLGEALRAPTDEAPERERLRTTDEIVYETTLNFLNQRVDHHRRMADMMKEPFKGDHQELAKAFQVEADRLHSHSDRAGDVDAYDYETHVSQWAAGDIARMLERFADADFDHGFHAVLNEAARRLRAASTDAPEEPPEVEKLLIGWEHAYPESIFPPPPEQPRKGAKLVWVAPEDGPGAIRELSEPFTIDSVSAAMGRSMAKALRRAFDADRDPTEGGHAPRYPWHPTEDDYREDDELRALDELALIAMGERSGDEDRIASLREQLRRRLRNREGDPSFMIVCSNPECEADTGELFGDGDHIDTCQVCLSPLVVAFQMPAEAAEPARDPRGRIEHALRSYRCYHLSYHEHGVGMRLVDLLSDDSVRRPRLTGDREIELLADHLAAELAEPARGGERKRRQRAYERAVIALDMLSAIDAKGPQDQWAEDWFRDRIRSDATVHHEGGAD